MHLIDQFSPQQEKRQFVSLLQIYILQHSVLELESRWARLVVRSRIQNLSPEAEARTEFSACGEEQAKVKEAEMNLGLGSHRSHSE